MFCQHAVHCFVWSFSSGVFLQYFLFKKHRLVNIYNVFWYGAFLDFCSRFSLLVVTKIVLESTQKLFLKKLWFVSYTLGARISLWVSFRVIKDTRVISGTYLSSSDRLPPKYRFSALQKCTKCRFWWWAIWRSQVASESSPGNAETDCKWHPCLKCTWDKP